MPLIGTDSNIVCLWYTGAVKKKIYKKHMNNGAL